MYLLILTSTKVSNNLKMSSTFLFSGRVSAGLAIDRGVRAHRGTSH